MNSNEILNFLAGIIQKEFPDELEIFNTYKYSLASKIEEGDDISDLMADSAAENEFMNVEGPVVASIALLSGTVKTVMEMANPANKKKLSGESLREKWKAKLKSEGFDDADSQRLTDQYMNQLLSML